MLASRFLLSCWANLSRIFKTRIHLCHHGPVFSTLGLSLVLLFVSLGVCRLGNLLLVLAILLEFYLSIRIFCYALNLSISCSKTFVSFVSGCWFVVVHSPSTCWYNFLSLFWNDLFCLYCLTLYRSDLCFPSLIFIYFFQLCCQSVVLQRFFDFFILLCPYVTFLP